MSINISSFEYFSGSFSLNSSTTAESLYVNGFAGGASADFDIIYDSLDFFASGALSLAYGDLLTDNGIYFTGFGSFAGGELTSDAGSIFWDCDGDLSCYEATFDGVDLDGDNIWIRGAMGAAYSTFSDLKAIDTFYAVGMLSFYQGTMTVTESDMNYYFAGFASGYQANIHCPANTDCTFYCYSRYACYNLVVDCDITSNCDVRSCDYNATYQGNFCPLGTFQISGDNVTVEDYGDYDPSYLYQFINYLDDFYDPMVRSSLGSQLQPMWYHQECAIFIDEPTQSGVSSGLMINGTTFSNYVSEETKGEDGSFICISGGDSQNSAGDSLYVGQEAVLDLTNAELDGYTVLCDGSDSCRDLDFSSNQANVVLCRGSSSCYRSNILGASSLSCSGADSCQGQIQFRRRRNLLSSSYDITDVETVFCVGGYSCQYTSVGLTGENGITEMTVYALGVQALNDVNIYNTGNNTVLTLVADAFQVLIRATVHCTGANAVCRIFCFGDSDCLPSSFNTNGCDNQGTTCEFYVNDFEALAQFIPTGMPSSFPTLSPTAQPVDASTTTQETPSGSLSDIDISSTEDPEDDDDAAIGKYYEAFVFVVISLLSLDLA